LRARARAHLDGRIVRRALEVNVKCGPCKPPLDWRAPIDGSDCIGAARTFSREAFELRLNVRHVNPMPAIMPKKVQRKLRCSLCDDESALD
jgi:hypothetical protein